MMKIMGYEYERKWHDDVNRWQFKQDKLREKHRSMLSDAEKEVLASEYKSTYGRSARQPFVQE